MTDTRKQIIELIEPYMDKTFSEWCLRYIYNEYDNFDIIYLNIEDVEIAKIQEDNLIIWHYDITAVLKYIKIKYDVRLTDNWNEFYLYIWTEPEYFQNKPLHLYTEEEEKDLLELLKKLWRTQEK